MDGITLRGEVAEAQAAGLKAHSVPDPGLIRLLAMPCDWKAASVMGILAADALLCGVVFRGMAGLLLPLLLLRHGRYIVRVNDPQDVLDDLPGGEFGEGPHALDMG